MAIIQASIPIHGSPWTHTGPAHFQARITVSSKISAQDVTHRIEFQYSDAFVCAHILFQEQFSNHRPKCLGGVVFDSTYIVQ